MKKQWRLWLVPALTLCLLFSSCSKGEESEPEKRKINEFTDRTATQAVEKIRTPIDKARNAQSTGEDRLKAMDESIQKQH